MAKKGRAGAALAMAALGSFFAGCVATVAIAIFAPILAGLAQDFSAVEYFSLMPPGLIAAIVLAPGSVIEALCMILLALLPGMVGTDVSSGDIRVALAHPYSSSGNASARR